MLLRAMRSVRKITRVFGGGCPFHSSLRSSRRCVSVHSYPLPRIECAFSGDRQHVERGRCLGGFPPPSCGSVAVTLHECQGEDTLTQIMDRQFIGPDVRHSTTFLALGLRKNRFPTVTLPSIQSAHSAHYTSLLMSFSPLQNGCFLNTHRYLVQLRWPFFP